MDHAQPVHYVGVFLDIAHLLKPRPTDPPPSPCTSNAVNARARELFPGAALQGAQTALISRRLNGRLQREHVAAVIPFGTTQSLGR